MIFLIHISSNDGFFKPYISCFFYHYSKSTLKNNLKFRIGIKQGVININLSNELLVVVYMFFEY